MGGKDETASLEEKVKVEGIGGTKLSVDDVNKNQDCCKLQKTNIGNESVDLNVGWRTRLKAPFKREHLQDDGG